MNASETQYEMKLVTPHFLACLGTGSRSLFVLYTINQHKSPSSRISVPDSNIPSRITHRKSALRLLNPERPMRLLDQRHLEACRARTSKSGEDVEMKSSRATDASASLSCSTMHSLGADLRTAAPRIDVTSVSLQKHDKISATF